MATAPSLTETKVFGMLERFSRAFTSGDGKKAAACWQVPALVVADSGTMAIASASQVEEFFGGAAKQYQAKGIYGTRPQLEEFRPITNTIASVLVRWPYLNIDGDDTGTIETSTYIARADDNGEAKDLRRSHARSVRIVAYDFRARCGSRIWDDVPSAERVVEHGIVRWSGRLRRRRE